MSDEPKNKETESKAAEGEESAKIQDAEKVALDAVELAQKEILYIRAEFENYRKRVLKDQDQAIRFANQNIICELLTVVDYFGKALEHADALKKTADSDALKNFISGIELTHHELIQVLGRFGVELVGKVGETFDPNRHEAIAQQESGVEDKDKVLVVAQRGCILNGRLLKPAKVVVAKK